MKRSPAPASEDASYAKEVIVTAHRAIIDASRDLGPDEQAAAHALMTIQFCRSLVSGKSVALTVPKKP